MTRLLSVICCALLGTSCVSFKSQSPLEPLSQSRAPSSEVDDAWATLAGIRFHAGDLSTNAAGGVDLTTLSEDAKSVLAQHLAATKRLASARGDDVVDRDTHLQFVRGRSRIGRLSGSLSDIKVVYSPFYLAVAGADAAFDDLEKTLYLSSQSAITGDIDITTAHEYLHVRVSQGQLVGPEFRPIFFVDQRSRSLRSDAIYYATFLRADEILAHLLEVNCLESEADAERRAEKMVALSDILKTTVAVANRFGRARSASSAIRPGRPVLASGHLRVDLNGSNPSALTELQRIASRLRPLADSQDLAGLRAEAKRYGLDMFCPDRLRFDP